jgi:hypothetical protein
LAWRRGHGRAEAALQPEQFRLYLQLEDTQHELWFGVVERVATWRDEDVSDETAAAEGGKT